MARTQPTAAVAANLIVDATDYKGEIRWDPSKPDGQPRRALDTSRARERLGFEAKTSLEDGLRATIKWYEASRRGSRVA